MRIPKPSVPHDERKLSLSKVAARWRVPVRYARHRLLMAGVPLCDVPQPSTEGVLLKDLEAYEERVRQGVEVNE
jgi:hypothetical protein